MCGSIRKEEAADNGEWQFLDPTAFEDDYQMVYDQEYQCFISPYYENNEVYPGVYDRRSSSDSTVKETYHPMIFRNNTDGIDEILCVGLSYIDTSVCLQRETSDDSGQTLPKIVPSED